MKKLILFLVGVGVRLLDTYAVYVVYNDFVAARHGLAYIDFGTAWMVWLMFSAIVLLVKGCPEEPKEDEETIKDFVYHLVISLYVVGNAVLLRLLGI